MKNRTGQCIFWTPRILSILFLFFLAMFSLDVLDMRLGFWETAAGVLVHNIPTLFLLAALIVSWKHEIVGGVAFTLAGMVYIVWLLKTILGDTPHQWDILSWSFTISGPAFLIGTLFLVGWYRKKRSPGRNGRNSTTARRRKPRSKRRAAYLNSFITHR